MLNDVGDYARQHEPTGLHRVAGVMARGLRCRMDLCGLLLVWAVLCYNSAGVFFCQQSVVYSY
jgi:hypothetical protein